MHRPAFQPILSLVTGEVVGHEAFSRFAVEPVRPPDAWFAEASRVGLGRELHVLAIERILAAAAEAGLPDGTFLSLNVSPRFLADPAVAAALGTFDGSVLVVEITEEEPVDDYPGLRQAMQPFLDRGVRFAVDDAGAGFASMRHVTELGPAFVKLDSWLVRGMRSQVTLQAFLRAVNVFAAEIGATLIAEGVEEASDVAAMTGTGFPLLVQGYAIARPGPPWPPVDPAAHHAWLEQRGARASVSPASEPPRIRGRHRPPSDRTPVESAVNIGVVLAASLHGAGVDDLETLRSIGSLAAWRRIRAIEPAIANERAIYALEGAVRGIRWSALTRHERARLVAEAEGR